MSYFFKIAQKWIYKEMGIGLTEKKKTTSLITNSLQTTKLAPFKCEISYECRTPILVEESSQIRQLIQTSV